MPANLEQIYAALQAVSKGVKGQTAALKAAQDSALGLLRASAARTEPLRAKVEAVARGSDPNVRCAVPVSEQIDLGYQSEISTEGQTLIAVDGSQVTPDRHEEALFGLINVAAVIMRTGSGRAPDIVVDTTLLFGQDLYAGDASLMSEGDIALLRDAAERRILLRQARGNHGTSIALADGPLELWGAKDVSDPGAFEKALDEYLEGLRLMESMGLTVAGYVDKPGADLVVRLLEIDQASADELKMLRSLHPLRGVSDRWLYSQILSAGERSAIFAMQSKSRARYTDALAIHFFYVNVGSEGHAVIARVEIPRWVANRSASVEALHSTLLEQCNLLGARPYPYILHRAHETAKIGLDEKEQIKLKLLLELRAAGVEPEPPSGKSSAKQVSEN